MASTLDCKCFSIATPSGERYTKRIESPKEKNMSEILFPCGSEWRKWDLAVNVSKARQDQGTLAECIKLLNVSPADVIGLCELYSVNAYRQIIEAGKCFKPLFPVVECCSHIDDKHGKTMGKEFRFRILFHNDRELVDRIEIFLNSLPSITTAGKRGILKDIDLTAKQSGTAYVNFFEVIGRLKSERHLRDNFLVILPYTSGVIAPTTDPFFTSGMLKHVDIIGSAEREQIDFFNWQSKQYSPEVIRVWLEFRKLPCIPGSDAGKLAAGDETSCWIKADPTFEGLRQVLHDTERVFVGKAPEIVQRKKSAGTKLIRSLSVSKTPGATGAGKWFDGLTIEFGSELVAIIGNKGSGKSALVDILGLVGNSRTEYFSFLTKTKFRKGNLAAHFTAELCWQDGSHTGPKRLDTDPEPEKPECVKYIPQNHFEKLCAGDGEEFENELKDVIFYHLDAAKRLGVASFRELVDKKRKIADGKIAEAQQQLTAVNKTIIELETKRTEMFRNKTAHLLAQKENELAAHQQNMPAEVYDPDTTAVLKKQSAELTAAIDSLRQNITDNEREYEAKQNRRAELEKGRAYLLEFLAEWNRVETGVKQWKMQDQPLLKEMFGIGFDEIITFSFRKELIQKKLAAVDSELAELALLLAEAPAEADADFSKQNLSLQKADLLKQLQNTIASLDEPHRKYETYLSEMQAWKARKNQIEGDDKTDGTILFYRHLLQYLDQKITHDLEQKYAERLAIAKEIFHQKREVLALYAELKAPVSTFLTRHQELLDEYRIALDVSLRLAGFVQAFVGFIDAEKSGTFFAAAQDSIAGLLDEADIQTEHGILALLASVVNALAFDLRSPDKKLKKFIHEQIKKGKTAEFYDYLFGLDYLVPEYDLRLDDKPLSELSPGERGSLLLVFYLMLDTDTTPLILDQPEDNLDNQSISKILVPFLKLAKKRRQIIMVTHNPNLAVVADAEQIIRIRIHKDHDHAVEIVAGSIETPVLNRHILDVLEGTEQAFMLRKKKYRLKERGES